MRDARQRIVMATVAYVWLGFLIVVPLCLALATSFAARGPYGSVQWSWNLANYQRVFDWLYLRIVLQSLWLAFVTSTTCLLLGFPIAYAAVTAGMRAKRVILLMVAVPFLTNFVLRAYAIRTLLGNDGPINAMLSQSGFIEEPLSLSTSLLSVYLGMVSTYLPFMVLPIFVALGRFDFQLLEAAYDLGASRLRAFWRVLVPAIGGGLSAGWMLVFIPTLGEFVIPSFLGGGQQTLIGNVIQDQFLKTRDWPFGAALSVVVILLMTGLLALPFLFVRIARRSAHAA